MSKHKHQIKALSLWQPWATLMAIGAKKIETRSWNVRYRGPLAICATKTWNPLVVAELYLASKNPQLKSDWHYMVEAITNAGYDALAELPLGSVLCIVDVVDCKQSHEFWHKITRREQAFGDYSDMRWGVVTDNLRRLKEPVPIRGRQGLFDIPYELIREYIPKNKR